MGNATRTCSADGCEGVHFGLSFCRKHYKRWKRNGTLEVIAPKKAPCAVEMCEKPHHSGGYCQMHYTRLKRTGSLDLSRKDRSFMDAPVIPGVHLNSLCIEWGGFRNPLGYGQYTEAGRTIQVHRRAWEEAHGPVPDGMVIDHICCNPPCMNVEHLRAVTRKQNSENSTKPGRPNAVSQYRGVTRREGGKWRVRVMHDGVSHNFGSFDTEKEANRAAIAARNTLFTHNNADRLGAS